MQRAMKETMSELWPRRSKDAVVKTPEEALTLASIVEKETGVPSERRMVAGVYINRLREGMRLQADPTIIYSIKYCRASCRERVCQYVSLTVVAAALKKTNKKHISDK